MLNTVVDFYYKLVFDINFIDLTGCSGQPELFAKITLMYTSFGGCFKNTSCLF